MASTTIPSLNDGMKTRLCEQTADNGRPLTEEGRLMLREAVECRKASRNLVAAICARITPLDGVELELPAREPTRPGSQRPDCVDRPAP